MVGPGGGPPTAFVVCSGLGHVARGFETFAREVHGALLGREDVRPVLALGRGVPGRGIRLAPTFSREGRAARLLGRASRHDGYWAEQAVYAASLVPHLVRERPDVVLVSDWALTHALGRIRELTRLRFRILLSNGAPGAPPFDPAIDHVQHLTPRTRAWALEAGEPPERHSVLPLGVGLPPVPLQRPDARRMAARAWLQLPPISGPVVLSVAALNAWSKRLDYVIREVASLRPRPFLLLVGQPEAETPGVARLARDLLGEDGFAVRTAKPEDMGLFYRVGDVLVLGSLHESMGRVLVEGLGHGLQVCAHDSEVTRFVLGAHGLRGDLSVPGALAELLRRALAEPLSGAQVAAQHADVQARFGWERLAGDWAGLLRAVAAQPPGRYGRMLGRGG